MKILKLLSISLMMLSTSLAYAESVKVKITPSMGHFMVEHTDRDGGVSTIKVMRNQDQKNTVSKHYALTSRKCAPFCIQPMKPYGEHDVEVLGEVGVISYIQEMQTNNSVMLIDSRTSDWVFLKSGTIPGAVNIPWTKLNAAKGATDEQIRDILEDEFGVVTSDDAPWNFQNAKTLVMFCNGMWCGQSPTNIKALLALGYPASKIKWYRGGMQNWEVLGLTTVKSARVVGASASDPLKEGRELAFNKKKGNCLACHSIAGGESPGNMGPPLLAMKARFGTKEKIRERLENPNKFNSITAMPPFGKNGILTDNEIDKIVDFLYSL